LQKKGNNLSQREFENICQEIVDLVESNAVEATQLVKQLAGVSNEKAWRVINYLKAENKLVVDNNGIARMNF
jgi:hypothetical protein